MHYLAYYKERRIYCHLWIEEKEAEPTVKLLHLQINKQKENKQKMNRTAIRDQQFQRILHNTAIKHIKKTPSSSNNTRTTAGLGFRPSQTGQQVSTTEKELLKRISNRGISF